VKQSASNRAVSLLLIIVCIAAVIWYLASGGKTPAAAVSHGVEISEIMTSNKGTVPDETGDFPDWIELHNTTDDEIDIGGFGLSDDALGSVKWTLPVGTKLQANEYLVVFCSGETDRGTYHAPFKISASDVVTLSTESGTIVEQVQCRAVTAGLSLAKDGAAVVEQAGVEYAVEYFVGTDLQIIKLLHKGVEITNYNYDPATGYITFTTSSFSPFEIVYIEVPAGAHKVVAGGKTKYFLDIKEAIAAASGEAEITLGSDIVLEETLVFDKDATISLDMNGFGISGELDTLVKISDGTLSIKNGSFTNIHNTANLTYYNIYMCGDAKAEIKDVTINTSGIGIMMAEDSKITEMNANIGSFMKYNGDNCFSAIYLVDSASIDLISGGKYVSYYSDEVIESRKAGSISVIGSHSLRLDSEKAHVGKITGGEFLSVDDVGGMGAPIYISAGTIDLISGGHFGFVEEGASFNTFCSIYLNTSAGSIGAITGGTFVVGKYGLNSSGFRWDFASLVDASGCNVVDTGKTSHVTVQFTGSNLQSYDLKIIQVVAK